MTVHQLQRHTPAWTFGDRLRKIRRDNHLTQAQLADMLGATAKAIDAWESDRNRPRDLIATATTIEDTFEIQRGWMLGYADLLPHLDSNQKPADYQMGYALVA